MIPKYIKYVDKKIIQLAKKEIKCELGTLQDLPYELANTIANIYYNFFEIPYELSEGAPRRTLQENKGPSAKVAYIYLLNKTAEARFIKPAVPSIIENLRVLKNDDLYLYNYAVELLLDNWKYGIRFAQHKNLIRRRIERIFRKRQVKEIPDLIKVIKI